MPQQLTHTFPWKRLSQFKVKIKDASTVAKSHLKPQPLLLPKVFEIAGFVTFYKNQKKRDFWKNADMARLGHTRITQHWSATASLYLMIQRGYQ